MKNQKAIKVRIERQFGNVRIFPACPTSELLIRLTGGSPEKDDRTCFCQRDIETLEALGYEVETVAPELPQAKEA